MSKRVSCAKTGGPISTIPTWWAYDMFYVSCLLGVAMIARVLKF